MLSRVEEFLTEIPAHPQQIGKAQRHPLADWLAPRAPRHVHVRRVQRVTQSAPFKTGREASVGPAKDKRPWQMNYSRNQSDPHWYQDVALEKIGN